MIQRKSPATGLTDSKALEQGKILGLVLVLTALHHVEYCVSSKIIDVGAPRSVSHGELEPASTGSRVARKPLL